MALLLALLFLLRAEDPEPRWESLFEPDGGRWAAIKVDGRAYVWGHGRFDAGQARAACAEPHRGMQGWRLPTRAELDSLPADSLLGVRLWIVEQGEAVVFESLEEPDPPGKAQPPTTDVICVRGEPLGQGADADGNP